jgi:3-deoxy-D-manno-octulosonic-acid transferase
MRSVLWGLYQVVWGGLLLVAGPFLLARRKSHYLESVPRRLGKGTAPAGGAPLGGAARSGALWLHAVSVGEVGVAGTLVRALPSDVRLLLTTVTPTGQDRAAALVAGLPGEVGRGAVDYLPFDLGFSVRRFFRRHAPAALVLVEGDYWPLVLREARRRGLSVAVVNGRVGDRSFRRMRRLRALLGPLFDGIERFGVQTEADRARLIELGVPAEKVTVTGNLKFESPEPPELPELAARLRGLAAGRPILVAGSTMAGEEAAVLEAFEGAVGEKEAMLVLAPRHPERWEEVGELLRGKGVRFVRRSEDQGEAPAVVLLDTLGELAAVYRLAAAAFVGGTLVPKGGHNPLEPARFGVPVAVGPSMENFRDIAEAFDRAGAWQQVAGAGELGAVWQGWLKEPGAAREVGERARRLVEENRGATVRTLEMLAPILEEVRRAAREGAEAPVAAAEEPAHAR